MHSTGGTDYWRRPGKTDGHSATTNHEGTDRLKVFSSSTPFDDDATYDKFSALAILEHGGDHRAAARALAATSPGPVTRKATTSAPANQHGDALLDDVAAFLARYVRFPSSEGCDAVALWCAHAHTIEAAESTPRLLLKSAEKQSGKTRTLEVLDLLTPAPLHASNISVAALFRIINSEQPTILLDEADAVFGPHAAEHHEDLPRC